MKKKLVVPALAGPSAEPSAEPPKGGTTNHSTPPAIIESLVAAGYTLEGFERKGETLVIRLTPADLETDSGQFQALETCAANNLQARCHVFAAIPQDLLIVSIKMKKLVVPPSGGLSAEPSTEPAKAGTTNLS